MPNQLSDILLHKVTKHTNLYRPYSDYVNGAIFPNQITSLLNTTVTLKYRNHYIADYQETQSREPIIKGSSSRPSDDDKFVAPTEGPDDIDPRIVFEDKFRIIRADAAEPYVLIGISEDYSKILVNSSKIVNGKYEYETKVSEWPVQDNSLIGIAVYDHYVREPEEIKGVTMRVDTGEPCYSVIMEILGSTGYVRFVLGDEMYSIVRDYYDKDGSYDYDNKNANEYPNPKIVDGSRADWSKINIFENINGGPADIFDTFTDKDQIMSDEDIMKFRKDVLGGIKIYGTN